MWARGGGRRAEGCCVVWCGAVVVIHPQKDDLPHQRHHKTGMELAGHALYPVGSLSKLSQQKHLYAAPYLFPEHGQS